MFIFFKKTFQEVQLKFKFITMNDFGNKDEYDVWGEEEEKRNKNNNNKKKKKKKKKKTSLNKTKHRDSSTKWIY